MPIAMMPGFATDEEMRQLAKAGGVDAGRMWLQLMRSHHVGGVNMAAAAIEMVSQEKVRRMARIQVDVQTFEIGQYDLCWLLTTPSSPALFEGRRVVDAVRV